MFGKRVVWMGCMLVCLASACNKDEPLNEILNEADEGFIREMTYSNLSEVEMGELATGKAADESVRNFGQMMVKHHDSLQADLKDIAFQNSYEVPGATDLVHQKRAESLQEKSGRSFDSAYVYLMVDEHDRAISLLNKEIQSGQDLEVLVYANNALPLVKQHRDMADSIATRLFPSP